MNQQFSMFDLWQPVPVRLPIDPYGNVVQGPPHETITLPHPRMAWPLARIELHQHTDGRWMWSASAADSCFKVGPKWGRFAGSRAAALQAAAAEIGAIAAGARSEGSQIITAAHIAQVKEWAAKMGH